MVKVALIGYGKMGKKIAELAPSMEVEVVATLTSSTPLTEAALQEAEVCIEFSRPDAAYKNIQKLCALKKAIVIGTTGWYAHLPKVKELVKKNRTAALYAENFSLGMQRFAKVVQQTAALLPEYSIHIEEAHHEEKVDCPSGTALFLANLVEVEKSTIHSRREGKIPGTHKVHFSSPTDTITLTHTAHTREGFAKGALHAAKWLQGKEGFYHLQEIL